MSDNIFRSWCSIYWMPIIGCSKYSAGCNNCTAIHEVKKRSVLSKTYRGLLIDSSVGPQWTGDIRIIEERIVEPFKWKKPQLAWVTSVSDLFHKKLSLSDIARIYSVMHRTPQHTYQVLTKRIERAREVLASKEFIKLVEEHSQQPVTQWPLKNVWLGTSVENQETCDRLDYLVETPAYARFVSFQPLLEEVDPGKWLKKLDLTFAVIGGESGLRRRPYKMSWGLKLQNQLTSAGVKTQLSCFPYGD